MSLKDELDTLRAASAEKFPRETLAVMQGATKDLIALRHRRAEREPRQRRPGLLAPQCPRRAGRLRGALGARSGRGLLLPGRLVPLLQRRAQGAARPAAGDRGARRSARALSPSRRRRRTTRSPRGRRTRSPSTCSATTATGWRARFGLTFRLPDAVNDIYKGFGIDLEASNGEASQTLPVPATFVIDKGGKVLRAFVDADYTQRLEPDEVIAALKEADD